MKKKTEKMEKIKEKVSNWLGFFKDHIQSFNVVAQEKNVVYFSKFSLEYEDFFEIHNFIINLKVNLLRALIDQFKYAVYNIILFSDKNLSEREKVMTIYSACFLNYYKRFLYDTNHSFEEFYDQNFICLVKSFKVEIKNMDLFKVLSFSFFGKIKEEIVKLNYESKIKPLKYVYNSKLNNKDNDQIMNTLFSNDNNNKINNDNKNKINIEPLKVKEKAINFVVSAKEKIVDIIYEIKYRNLFPKIFPSNNNEINIINTRLNHLNNVSAQHMDKFYKTLEKEKIKFDDICDNGDINISLNDDKTSAGYNESLNNSINTININLNNSFNSLNKMSEISNSDSFKSNMDFINNIKNINKKSNDIKNINNISLNINKNNINNNNEINLNKINFTNNDNNINKLNNNQNSINEIDMNNEQFDTNNKNQQKSAFKPNNIISHNPKDKDNIYSHRLIEELIKNKIDDKTMEIITNVVKKIDNHYLDYLLNNIPKPTLILGYFSCYVATFTPKMLQDIDPDNSKILENIYIKFIILAKELYNTSMELFCSLYDLTGTNINRFLDMANICGIHVQYAKGLYKFFSDYSMFLLEENAFQNLEKTVGKFIEMERLNWEKVVNEGTNSISSL